MPDNIKALIYILSVSIPAFILLTRSLNHLIPTTTLYRAIKVWFILVCLAFILPDFWFFVLATIIILILFGPNNPENRIIFYFLLLCALPILWDDIPGFGSISNILPISYTRLLILILLLPLLFVTKSQNNYNAKKLFRFSSDKYIVILCLLIGILNFRDDTITNAIRVGLLLLLDIFIPYYLVSRNVNSLTQFNQAITALFCTIIPVTVIGVLELRFHWHFYNELFSHLSTANDYIVYDIRAGIIRASSIFVSPIVYGYVIMIGFGLLIYLQPLLKNRLTFYIYAGILTIGIFLSVSRGPWLGLVVLFFVYIWTGREKLRQFGTILFFCLITIPLISLTPVWNKFIQLLPFVGTVRADTIDYRERLFENAWIVFQKNPMFGSTTYIHTPEMESMRQGEGIIDIVNTYLVFGLSYGLIGVILFLLTFLGLIFTIYRIIQELPKTESDLHRLGRVLIAILASILFTIATVSPIDFIPVFYWTFAALAAAYTYIAKKVIYENRVTN